MKRTARIGHFDTVDLRLFVEAAESNSLRRGAELLKLSAPAASTRIKHLEETTGIRLLHRTNQGVSLTPAGRAFLHHAKLVLMQLENLGNELREYSQNIVDHIRIAVNSTGMTELLPTVLEKFMIGHPNVGLEVVEECSGDIVRSVTSGTADLGIISKHVSSHGLEVIDLIDVRLVLVVSPRHPLASNRKVTLGETLRYQHLGFRDLSPTQYYISRSPNALKSAFRARIQAANADSMFGLIEAGVGIGVVPEPSALRHARNRAVKVIELADSDAMFRLRVCARSFDALPKHARMFLEILLSSRPSFSHASTIPSKQRSTARRKT